jgi:hypothetical protein
MTESAIPPACECGHARAAHRLDHENTAPTACLATVHVWQADWNGKFHSYPVRYTYPCQCLSYAVPEPEAVA